MDNVDIKKLTDEELWSHTENLALCARDATADLVDALAELDSRRLPEKSVYASLYDYCVHKLLMSEACAYRHIRAARAVRRFPPIGPALRRGRLNLQVIALLHPHLEDPDAEALVAAALGKRVHEVEALIAPRRTEAPHRDVVRLIAASPATSRPAPPPDTLFQAARSVSEAPAESPPTPPPAATAIDPTAIGERYESRMRIYAEAPEAPAAASRSLPARHHVRIAFTADESFDQLLKEVQAAMRHKHPDGRLEGIFRDALKALLRKNRPWAFPRSRKRP